MTPKVLQPKGHEPPAQATVAPLTALIAFDASEPATAAVRVAAALASNGRIVPTILSVQELSPFGINAAMPSPLAVANALMGNEGEDSRRRVVHAETRTIAEAAAEWPVQLAVGSPAAAIDDAAVTTGSGLVIMGVRRHGPLGRALGDETTLNVIRRGHCGVFGVASWLHRVPKRIVVGTDFSRASLQATILAARLLAEHGRLILAYVETPADYSSEEREGRRVIHDEGLRAAFARACADLPLPTGATVEPVERNGEPAIELLELVDHVSADVIAVGRHHHGIVSRVLRTGVTTTIVRDGRCSVLVTPPPTEAA